MKRAIYPGSFDPFHEGHKSIYLKASQIFDEVIIYIANNEDKNHVYSLGQRKEIIQSFLPTANIIADIKLTALVARENKCNFIIRGIRDKEDLEYEEKMAYTNKSLSSKLETILLFSDESLKHISSTALKLDKKFSKNLKELKKYDK